MLGNQFRIQDCIPQTSEILTTWLQSLSLFWTSFPFRKIPLRTLRSVTGGHWLLHRLSLALFLAPRRLFPDETRRPDVLTPRDHWLVHDIKPISSLRCLQLLTFRILTKTVNAVTIEFFLYLLLKTGSRTSDVDFQFFIQVIAFFLSTYLRIKILRFLEIM